MVKNSMGLKTKRKILDAAHALFQVNGIENTRVEDIAVAAGITKAMVYYHFDGKESIILELVSELLCIIQEAMPVELNEGLNQKKMYQFIGDMMNLWKANSEIGLFLITKGMKDDVLLSKVISISKPFFDLLISKRDASAEPRKLEMDDSEKFFKLMLFNTLPMILSSVMIRKFASEFEMPEEVLNKSFQDEFAKVMYSILNSK